MRLVSTVILCLPRARVAVTGYQFELLHPEDQSYGSAQNFVSGRI